MTGEQLKKYVHDRCIEEGDCWIWQRVINVQRPQMVRKGKTLAVRRELWKALRNSDIQPSHLITTTCGVHGCVNPDHLCMSTMAKVQKKAGEQGKYSTLQRRAKVAAAKRKQGKLTLELVQEIRASPEPLKAWAERLGVSLYCISSARTGRTWKEYSSPFAGLLG